jgi:hypothetical protein
LNIAGKEHAVSLTSLPESSKFNPPFIQNHEEEGVPDTGAWLATMGELVRLSSLKRARMSADLGFGV